MVSISLVKRKYRTADGKEATTKDWYAQIRFPEQNASYLRSTGLTDKRKAKDAARRLAKEIEANELPERGKPAFTLEGMFSQWIAEHGKDLRSKKDIKWQVELILAVMNGSMLIRNITNKTVHEFVQGAKELGKSEIVINRCLTRLRATLAYAEEKWEATISHKIKWGSHFGEEPEEKEMYIGPELARRFVEVLPPHIGFAFAFSYHTGCRLNEMQTLTWDRVSFEERIAVVETKGRGKRTKYRKVKLNDQAILALRTVQALPKPPLKPRRRRKEPDPNAVFFLENRRKHWEKARRLLGCEEAITWHGIRHTFGTETSRGAEGKDKLVGKLLGHSPNSTATKRYIRALDADMEAAVSRLPDIGMPKLPAHENGRDLQTTDTNREPLLLENPVVRNHTSE